MGSVRPYLEKEFRGFNLAERLRANVIDERFTEAQVHTDFVADVAAVILKSKDVMPRIEILE